MRRLARLSTLFLVLALAVDWDPLIPPIPLLSVAQVRAQPPAPGLAGPGGIIYYTASSASAVNTAGTISTNLFDYTLPAAFVATTSFISVTGTTTSVNVVAASVPLHLHCNGRLNTLGTSTANVGASFGPPGSTNTALFATATLIPGTTLQAVVNVPMTVDVWLAPVATSTTPTSTTTFLNARLAFQSGAVGASPTLATETVFSGAQTANVSLGSANQLRVQWLWSAASTANSAILYNCALIQGN